MKKMVRYCFPKNKNYFINIAAVINSLSNLQLVRIQKREISVKIFEQEALFAPYQYCVLVNEFIIVYYTCNI